MTKPHARYVDNARELLEERTITRMKAGDATLLLVDMNRALANALLTLNIRNRRLRPDGVDRLARQIDAGQWKFTGDPLRISTDWVLIDGQHRLNAVINSTVPVFSEQMVVITGLDPSVVMAIDQQEKRTVADLLGFIGIKGNQQHLAATVKKLLWYEDDFFSPSRSAPVSSADVDNWIAEHTDEAATIIDTFRTKIGVPSSALSLFAILTGRVNPSLARDFMMLLSNRIASDDGHPIAAILNNKTKLNASSDADFRKALYGLTMAWNNWLDGNEMYTLLLRSVRVTSRTFPDMLTEPGEDFEKWTR